MHGCHRPLGIIFQESIIVKLQLLRFHLVVIDPAAGLGRRRAEIWDAVSEFGVKGEDILPGEVTMKIYDDDLNAGNNEEHKNV